MARRYIPEKRDVLPDAKYQSRQVSMFINRMMSDGKKSVATRVLYDALNQIETGTEKAAVDVFDQALNNVSPVVEVKPRRVGGATYQVPIEVPPSRRRTLAMRWLIDAAHSRPGKSMADKLAAELTDAANNTGVAMKKREEVHRMAESNRAFSHYRFGRR